jgi:hypothetical protein
MKLVGRADVIVVDAALRVAGSALNLRSCWAMPNTTVPV